MWYDRSMKQVSHILALCIVYSLVTFSMGSFLPVRAADSADDLVGDISDTQKRIEKERAKEAALANELGQINVSLSKTQAAIAAAKTRISEATNDIDRKQAEIELMQERIEGNRLILTGLLREIRAESDDPLFGSMLSGDDMTRALNNPDRFRTVGDRIRGILDDMRSSREQVAVEKASLEELKQEHEELLGDKLEEKQTLASDLTETQADLADQRKVIADLQSKLNALRSRYSELLGESVSTDDILKAAKFAASATGMNKSFLLGVLVQESNKGQSVGTCDYKESKMTSTQLSALKKIADELDYNYKKLKFSCPPKSYSGTGGAMGVAQFMPTTWLGYQGTISSLTGHHPPDPWNLVDGVTAMASKLANDGAAKKDRFYEAKSYCVYLAGSNWGYYCYGSASKYKKSYKGVNCWGSTIKNYGEKVLCLKDNYEQFYE